MIKQSTIDELRNRMEITEVIGRFADLKKRGKDHTACCPFHNEKTPSFHVWRSKQIYKCFGCGEGGDAIKFVMKHERKSFTEAIEWLCSMYTIQVEWDQAALEQAEEKKETREEMLQVLALAQKKWEKLLHSLPEEAPPIQYLQQRGYSHERMRSWSLGFAPADWKFLTTPLIEMGKHGTAVDLGLIGTSEGKNWDFFRNRIIIPIHDHNGILVGFGGRLVPGSSDDDRSPKYLNSSESLVYSKGKIWYGLHQAQRAIKDLGFAYIAEGYMDVQAMHDADILNTVAACGTEIDALQVKLLKRYTDHVVLALDSDEAGTRKILKHIDLFLKHEFKVGVVEFPKGMDPDEYIRHLQQETPALAEELLVE